MCAQPSSVGRFPCVGSIKNLGVNRRHRRARAAFRNGAPDVKHKIPVPGRPRSPTPTILFRRRRQEGAAFMPGAALAFGPEPRIAWFAGATARVWRRRTRRSSAESKPFRFRSRPRLHVSGKVHVTSAAGHLPSVRGRLAGRLHDAWSNPVPECPSQTRARTRQRASATRRLTTSSGTASRRGRPWTGCLSRGGTRSFLLHHRPQIR